MISSLVSNSKICFMMLRSLLDGSVRRDRLRVSSNWCRSRLSSNRTELLPLLACKHTLQPRKIRVDGKQRCITAHPCRGDRIIYVSCRLHIFS
jgi:hypothetical protein